MARFLGIGNGSDGVLDLNSYTPLKYSCSGNSGSKSLTATGSFSPGQRLFIIQSMGSGVGGYEDNQVDSYSSGVVTLVHPLERNYVDSGSSQAQVLIVKQASSVTGSITVPAWDGNTGGVLVIACNGLFDGNITANGRGYRGASRIEGYRNSGRHGEGYAGTNFNAIATVAGANNAGSGGGGAYNHNADAGSGAGGGGYGTTGSNGVTQHTTSGSGAGAGGGTVGVVDLSSLYFGGGGGSGSTAYNTDPGDYSGYGGAGGGIIVIYTDRITNTSSLWANGANGGNGTGGYSGGGGGGAGGSILIKGVNIPLGSNKIGAGAGTRGSGGDQVFNGWGGNGGKGRIRIEACSLSGNISSDYYGSYTTSLGGHDYCAIMGGFI